MEEEFRRDDHDQNVLAQVKDPQIVAGKEHVMEHGPEGIKINEDPCAKQQEDDQDRKQYFLIDSKQFGKRILPDQQIQQT